MQYVNTVTRYVGAIQLVFFNNTCIFANNVWLGDCKSKNIQHKHTHLKEVGLQSQNILNILVHSVINIIGGTYAFIHKINTHTHPITFITK